MWGKTLEIQSQIINSFIGLILEVHDANCGEIHSMTFQCQELERVVLEALIIHDTRIKIDYHETP